MSNENDVLFNNYQWVSISVLLFPHEHKMWKLRGQHDIQAQIWGIRFTIYEKNFLWVEGGGGGQIKYFECWKKSEACYTPPKLILLDILVEHFMKSLFLSRKS